MGLPSGFADKNILKLVIDIARASDVQRSFRVRLRFLSTPLRSSLAKLCIYETDLYQAARKNYSIQRSGPSKGAVNLNHDQNDMGKDLDPNHYHTNPLQVHLQVVSRPHII